MKKMIIGSAQFGTNYGISNLGNGLEVTKIKSILKLAKKNQIEFIDTAISYGQSEEKLGKIDVNDFKIISKLPKIPNETKDVYKWVIEQIESSISRLNVKSLYGFLLHHPLDLIGPKGKKIVKALEELKLAGLIYKVGVSIYDPKELDHIFSLLDIDIVQSPLNLIDRRLEKSGWLSKLYNENIEVHARSIFLQGLLLMPRNKIPKKFEKWSNIWDEWNLRLNEYGLDAVDVCLSYPLTLKEVSGMTIGINDDIQLKEIILASKKTLLKKDWSFMISNNKKLIIPSNWESL